MEYYKVTSFVKGVSTPYINVIYAKSPDLATELAEMHSGAKVTEVTILIWNRYYKRIKEFDEMKKKYDWGQKNYYTVYINKKPYYGNDKYDTLEIYTHSESEACEIAEHRGYEVVGVKFHL